MGVQFKNVAKNVKTSGSAMAVEILQLQNISLENVWHYLRDPTFSRFDTIRECDRHTDTQTHDDDIYRAQHSCRAVKNGSNEQNHAPLRVICHPFGQT